MRLYKKLHPEGSENRKKGLIVPRVITLFQKCVEHQIQDYLIKHLHFNDLYVLILSLDIQNIKDALHHKEKMASNKSDADIRDISPEEAVKFLKGGGMNG